MIPVMGLSLVSVECHGFYNKPIEIFKISGITLLGGLLCLHQKHPKKQPPLGRGLLICMVLMVLLVILVFLGVVLVVLEVTGPQVAPTQVDPTVPSSIIRSL